MSRAEFIALLLFMVAGALFIAGVYTLVGLGWSLLAGSAFLFCMGVLIVRGSS